MLRGVEPYDLHGLAKSVSFIRESPLYSAVGVALFWAKRFSSDRFCAYQLWNYRLV